MPANEALLPWLPSGIKMDHMSRKPISPEGDASRFCFLITPAERAMLDRLAEADDRSAANWLRNTIRDVHATRFPTRARPVAPRRAAKPLPKGKRFR